MDRFIRCNVHYKRKRAFPSENESLKRCRTFERVFFFIRANQSILSKIYNLPDADKNGKPTHQNKKKVERGYIEIYGND